MRGFTVAVGAGARVLGAWMDTPEVTVAGAAFDQPVAFRRGSGDLPLGDWSDYALVCYSGEVCSARSWPHCSSGSHWIWAVSRWGE